MGTAVKHPVPLLLRGCIAERLGPTTCISVSHFQAGFACSSADALLRIFLSKFARLRIYYYHLVLEVIDVVPAIGL